MAKREDFKLSRHERQRRIFSEDFKRSKVRELELGLVTVLEVSRAHQVSTTTVYRWLSKLGSTQGEKQERLVVESLSDSVKLLEMKKQIAELERIIGQKQLLIDFQQKMLELAGESCGTDLKKNFSGPPSGTSGTIGKSSA